MMDFGEVDVLMPSQYYELHRRERALDPWRRLMFAVLSDAIECFMGLSAAALANCDDRHPHRARRLALEAESWIQQPDGDGPFAFDNVCAALDIEPTVLRRGLFQWRRRREAGVPARMPRLSRPRSGDGPIRLPGERRRRQPQVMA